MGQLKDLVVTGATRLLGKITTKDVEINGGLIINPGDKNYYNEGIRINKASCGWTSLVLGGSSGSTTGTENGIWSIHTYQGDFYLSHNGSNNGYPMIAGYKTGYWSVYGRTYFNNGITIPNNICSLLFRDDSTYASWISHQTVGNEALVFGTNNVFTSFIFSNGTNYSNISNTQWTTISDPGLQIKNNCVSIGELIADGVAPTYKLNVNGDINIKGNINISGTLNGTASKANILNITNGNEINFSGLSNQNDISIWFNYRDPDTRNSSGNTNITQYNFGNRNGNITGVTLVTDDIKVLIDNELVSLKSYVSNGKTMVADAITDMGVTTLSSATFADMATNILSIKPSVGYVINNGHITISAKINDKNTTSLNFLIPGDATKENVLSGKTFCGNGAGWGVTGTMPDNGAVSASLNCDGSYTIPAGYHNGSGIITAASLSSQTQATATSDNILGNKTAWVNGTKITGTMTYNSPVSASLKCGNSYTIPAGYHDGSAVITATSLSSQTQATATSDNILYSKTAWVNGTKITGTVKKALIYALWGDYVCSLTSVISTKYIIYDNNYSYPICNCYGFRLYLSYAGVSKNYSTTALSATNQTMKITNGYTSGYTSGHPSKFAGVFVTSSSVSASSGGRSFETGNYIAIFRFRRSNVSTNTSYPAKYIFGFVTYSQMNSYLASNNNSDEYKYWTVYSEKYKTADESYDVFQRTIRFSISSTTYLFPAVLTMSQQTLEVDSVTVYKIDI